MPGVNSVNPVEMFRILRICFMFPPSAVIVDAGVTGDTETSTSVNGEPASALAVSAAPTARRSPTTLSYETFTPELVRDLEQLAESPPADADPASVPTRVVERMEMMKETFSKVIAYLRNTGQFSHQQWSVFTFPTTVQCDYTKHLWHNCM